METAFRPRDCLVWALAAVLPACHSAAPLDSAPTGTLYVLVTTDMVVPQELDRVELETEIVGTGRTQRLRVGDGGPLFLPWRRALTNLGTGGQTLRVQVTAWKASEPQVVLEARVLWPREGARTLRLALSSLCRGTRSVGGRGADGSVQNACGSERTCKEGQCVGAEVGTEDGEAGSADGPVESPRPQAVEGALTDAGSEAFPRAPNPVYVSGTVAGLGSEGLVLAINGKVGAPMAAGETNFHGLEVLAPGTAFVVQIAAQPKGHVCTVDPPIGIFGDGSESRVQIRCLPLLEATAVSAGINHGCALLKDRTVRCWGASGLERVGARGGSTSVPGLADGLGVAVGRDHTCVVRVSGGLRCWESEDYSPNAETPITSDVPGVSGAVGVAAATYLTCVLRAEGTVRCVYRMPGELDEGGLDRDIPGLSGVVEVVAGEFQTCARLARGTLRCWSGARPRTWPDGTKEATVDMPGLVGVKTVALGEAQGCAVLENGTVRCWGRLAMVYPPDPLAVHEVPGLSHAVTIALGGARACAVLDTGLVQCWNLDKEGRMQGERSPPPSQGLSRVTSLSAMADNACAIHSEGRVRCWGANDAWQYGEGRSPVELPGLSGIISLSAGWRRTCAVGGSGSLHCWGASSNEDGATIASVRREWPGMTGLATVAMGSGFGCLTYTSGAFRCGMFGERDAPSPLVALSDVPGMTHIRDLSMSYEDTLCFIDSEGSAACVEPVRPGRGVATVQYERTSPGWIPNVTSLAEGRNHTCMTFGTGGLGCWGNNGWGQVGGPNLYGTEIPGVSGMVRVSVGLQHSCALAIDGTVRCFGDNRYGQTAGSDVNHPIVGVSGVIDLSSGTYHTCVLLQDGTVRCWGQSERRQTGGSSPFKSIAGLRDVLGISCGEYHCCARLLGGRVVCWGDDTYGQTSGFPSRMFDVPLVP